MAGVVVLFGSNFSNSFFTTEPLEHLHLSLSLSAADIVEIWDSRSPKSVASISNTDNTHLVWDCRKMGHPVKEGIDDLHTYVPIPSSSAMGSRTLCGMRFRIQSESGSWCMDHGNCYHRS